MLNSAIARNLSSKELINNLDDKRKYSFIIDELCRRLEKSVCTDAILDHKVKCPVCQATLMCAIDDGNNLFTLKVDKYL